MLSMMLAEMHSSKSLGKITESGTGVLGSMTGSSPLILAVTLALFD